MQENLNVPKTLAKEFIELHKKIKPLSERSETVKIALRGFGPANYQIDGLGSVVVSRPGVARLTGKKLVVHETNIDKVDPTVLKALFDSGFIEWEEQWSRATASKVEARLPT